MLNPVLLLHASAILTSPFIIFEYQSFFNGAPCVTKIQTESTGSKSAMEHYLDVNKYITLAQAILGF
eukprot:SAG11_NODE_15851_length_564_cov_1.333333_1_plen_66_part_10